MTAVDTSAFVLYLQEDNHHISKKITGLLELNMVVLPPVVLAELLSDPRLPIDVGNNLINMQVLDILPDYWIRVGNMRRILLSKGLKSKLPDAMIAQSCLDHNLPLLTGDYDFRHYKNYFNLTLV